MTAIEQTHTIKQRIDSLEKAIRGGNGDYGLVTDVVLIKTMIQEINKDIDFLWDEMRKANQSRQELHDIVIRIDGIIGELAKSASMNQKEHQNLIDFRWVVERIMIPLLLPLLGSAIGAGIIMTNLEKILLIGGH